jgi:hypothetical protein
MSSLKITVDAGELVQQAAMTVDSYLSDAINRIDRLLGVGYAASHPELLGVFIRACAADYHSAMLLHVGNRCADALLEIARLDNLS